MKHLIEKIYAAAYKKEEVILPENEEDCMALFVLEGSVSKVKDRRLVAKYTKN